MSSISHHSQQQSISIPAPAHAERALTLAPNNAPPPPYTSPVFGAVPVPGPSRAPSPLPELRLETVGIAAPPKAPRSDSDSGTGARNRDSWTGDARSGSATAAASGTESDITSGGGAASGPTSGQGLVHIPLTPHSAAAVAAGGGIAAAKTPEQRARRDPIAMLLYLRRTVALTPPPKKDTATSLAPAPLLAQPIPYNEKRKHRRHSSASVSSDTTAVDDEEPTKEKDLAEPFSAAPAVNYAHKLPVVHVKPSDLEAQLDEADRHRIRSRKTLIILFIIIMAILFLTSAALGIYSIVHHGF